MRNAIALVTIGGALLMLGPLGCENIDNVAVCEAWSASVTCGDYVVADDVDCTVYEETGCEIQHYFDCLTDKSVCDEESGIMDMTAWPECDDQAVCE